MLSYFDDRLPTWSEFLESVLITARANLRVEKNTLNGSDAHQPSVTETLPQSGVSKDRPESVEREQTPNEYLASAVVEIGRCKSSWVSASPGPRNIPSKLRYSSSYQSCHSLTTKEGPEDTLSQGNLLRRSSEVLPES
jgi:hypothetical protein